MNTAFYIISIGPGDPELITIQALKTLLASDIVFVPNRSPDNEWKGSISYDILSKFHNKLPENFLIKNDKVDSFMKKLRPLYTPMNYSQDAWNNQVDAIVNACRIFQKVSYVTLGDAAISSSAYYILEIIKVKYPEIFSSSVILPGISSYSLASSLVKKPLSIGETNLEIINLNNNISDKTKVFMRPQKGQDLSGFKGDNIYFFKNLGLKDEFYGQDIPDKTDNYLSLIVDFASTNNFYQNNKED